MSRPTPPGDSAPARRILTVCLGNYCRSPFAAAVLHRHGGSAVEVRSAGLHDKWVGQPAHPDMIAAAADRGYDLTGHRGTQVDSALLAWADLVLALDHAILQALRDIADAHTTPTLALYLDGHDVPDPFGHPAEVFAACAAMIEDGASAHLR